MRLVRYLAYNWLFASMLVVGALGHVEWAATTALVIGWTTIVTSLASLSKPFVEHLRSKGSVVPLWVDQVFDGLVISFLLFCGWWITAIGYFVHMIMVSLLYKRAFGSAQP